MHFFTAADRRYAQFDLLRNQPGLAHAYCLRPLDVSPRRDDHQAARDARRMQMVADLGLASAELCYCIQVHTPEIELITEPRPAGALEGRDAIILTTPAVAGMTFSADCPLVILYEPHRRILGLAHASWRCTVARLTAKVARQMIAQFGCAPDKMLAGIGPGAGPCCYEVKADVYEAAAVLASRDDFFIQRDDKLYFDLWQANRAQLLAAGLPENNIETAGVCTMCRNDLFYSFRREGPGCGHFGLLAALTPHSD